MKCRIAALLALVVLCIVPAHGAELTIRAYTLEGTRTIPVAGASFTLYAPDGSVAARVTTGAGGQVTLARLPRGRYLLQEDGPRHRPAMEPTALQLMEDGTLSIGGVTVPRADVLYRRLPFSAALRLLIPLSLLPAFARLGWLRRREIRKVLAKSS